MGRRWHAEKSRLERQLREVQERTHKLEAARSCGTRSDLADLASAQAEAGFFREELAAEKFAASFARERLAAARLELEEARQSQARFAAKGEQTLASTAQEIAL